MRVSGVRRFRHSGKPQNTRHHTAHRGLICPPRAGHGGLYLRGCMKVDRDAAGSRSSDDHPRSVGGTNHRVDLFLGKDTLDGQSIRLVDIQPAFGGSKNFEDALIQTFSRGSTGNSNLH